MKSSSATPKPIGPFWDCVTKSRLMLTEAWKTSGFPGTGGSRSPNGLWRLFAQEAGLLVGVMISEEAKGDWGRCTDLKMGGAVTRVNGNSKQHSHLTFT